MAERSADWIAQGHRDLALARNALGSGFYEWACFGAQQAAEKAVKAVFQRFGDDAWGHDIARLLAALTEMHGIVVREDLRNSALELDKAYIPTRYPDAHQGGSPATNYTYGEAERLIGHAEEVVRFCDDLLPGIHPD